MHNLHKIMLTVVALLCVTTLSAQSQVHVVQEGETVYAIGRKYNVDPMGILRLNPSLGNGDRIIPGQKLRLPDKKLGQATTTTAAPKQQTVQPVNTPVKTTAQPTTTTTVKPVVQQQVVVQQPQPTTTTVQPSTTTVQQSTTQGVTKQTWYKEMYRIVKKDNLYKVALEHGLTIEELVAANPPLTTESKLKKDEFLYIPYSKAEKQAMAQRAAQEKAAKVAAEQAARARIAHFYHQKIAVILPFKEGSDRSAKMIEFYQGLLMAADSVKRQGVSVDIYAFNSGSTAADMKTLLTNRAELKNMDVIFGPLDVVLAPTLSEFCQENKIRLVFPFATTLSTCNTNPYVYQAAVSTTTAIQQAEAKFMKQFPNGNLIVLQTGMQDSRGEKLTSELQSLYATRGRKAQTLSINGDNTSFAAVLNQFQENIIIPDASSLTSTNMVIKRLNAFVQNHPEYKVTLLGYPEWTAYVSTLLQEFYSLNTYVYTPFYRNPTEGRVSLFETRFKHNFKKEQGHTFPRYGMKGFDIGYFFMYGLAKLGDAIDTQAETLGLHPFQNGLHFEQNTSGSSYLNTHVELVHYTTNRRIETIK